MDRKTRNKINELAGANTTLIDMLIDDLAPKLEPRGEIANANKLEIVLPHEALRQVRKLAVSNDCAPNDIILMALDRVFHRINMKTTTEMS